MQLLAQDDSDRTDKIDDKNANWAAMLAEDFWASWATANQNGSLRGPRYAPGNTRVVALRSREQAGYGLVNIQFGFRYQNGTRTYWSDWLTTNFRGKLNPAVSIDDDKAATGIEAKEQAGFGLVDARLVYAGGRSDWLTDNPNGSLRRTICGGGIMSGLLVREQAGYGLINIRCHCT
jgi:hypothetical protein